MKSLFLLFLILPCAAILLKPTSVPLHTYRTNVQYGSAQAGDSSSMMEAS